MRTTTLIALALLLGCECEPEATPRNLTKHYAYACAIVQVQSAVAESIVEQQDDLPTVEDQPKSLAPPAKTAESVSEPVEPGPDRDVSTAPAEKPIAAPKPRLILWTLPTSCPGCRKLDQQIAGDQELAGLLSEFDLVERQPTAGMQIPRFSHPASRVDFIHGGNVPALKAWLRDRLQNRKAGDP